MLPGLFLRAADGLLHAMIRVKGRRALPGLRLLRCPLLTALFRQRCVQSGRLFGLFGGFFQFAFRQAVPLEHLFQHIDIGGDVQHIILIKILKHFWQPVITTPSASSILC